MFTQIPEFWIPEITSQKMQVSSILKTCDMSDLLNSEPPKQPYILWTNLKV